MTILCFQMKKQMHLMIPAIINCLSDTKNDVQEAAKNALTTMGNGPYSLYMHGAVTSCAETGNSFLRIDPESGDEGYGGAACGGYHRAGMSKANDH